MKATFLFSIFILIPYLFSIHLSADTNLIINELLPDAVGTDTGKEYIEIYNTSSSAAQLVNAYFINTSQSGSSKKIIIPDSQINPNSYFVIAEDLTTLQISNGISIGNGKLALFNDYGKLQLFNNGVLVYELSYGDSKEGVAWELDGPLCGNLLSSIYNTVGLYNSVSISTCFNIPISYTVIPINPPRIEFSLDSVVWTDTLSSFIGKDIYFRFIPTITQSPISEKWTDKNNNPISSPHKFNTVYSDSVKLELKYDDQTINSESMRINIQNNITNKVVITEVYPSPESGDDEWIEIYNNDSHSINLKDYVIEEKTSTGVTNRKSLLPDVTIAPREYYVVYEEDLTISLNNSGDSIYLFDINGNQINKFSYTQVSTSQSVGRKFENGVFSEETFILMSPTPKGENRFVNSKNNLEFPFYTILDINSLQGGTEFMLKANIIGSVDKYAFLEDNTMRIKAKLTTMLDRDLLNTFSLIKAKVVTKNGAKNIEINPANIEIIDYIDPAPVALNLFNPETSDIGKLVAISAVVDQVYSNRVRVRLSNDTFSVYFYGPANLIELKKGTILNIIGVVDYYRGAFRVIANEYYFPNVLSEFMAVSYPTSFPQKDSSLLPKQYPTDESRTYLILLGYLVILIVLITEVIRARKAIHKSLKKKLSKINLFGKPVIKY